MKLYHGTVFDFSEIDLALSKSAKDSAKAFISLPTDSKRRIGLASNLYSLNCRQKSTNIILTRTYSMTIL